MKDNLLDASSRFMVQPEKKKRDYSEPQKNSTTTKADGWNLFLQLHYLNIGRLSLILIDFAGNMLLRDLLYSQSPLEVLWVHAIDYYSGHSDGFVHRCTVSLPTSDLQDTRICKIYSLYHTSSKPGPIYLTTCLTHFTLIYNPNLTT